MCNQAFTCMTNFGLIDLEVTVLKKTVNHKSSRQKLWIGPLSVNLIVGDWLAGASFSKTAQITDISCIRHRLKSDATMSCSGEHALLLITTPNW